MNLADGFLTGDHSAPTGIPVRDVHGGFAATRMQEVVRVRETADIVAALRRAEVLQLPVAICGARYAGGGQNFVTAGMLLDTAEFNRVIRFDAVRGLVCVQAGITWPQLVEYLLQVQSDVAQPWTIAQKQSGADAFSLGGALSANIHGRGLRMRPFSADVESCTLVDASGAVIECSRQINAERFRLVCGGYGLFGMIDTLTLRLVRRRKLRRDVQVLDLAALPQAFAQRVRDGYQFGDFQFAIDPASADFLRLGVFSCYRPVADSTPLPDDQRELTDQDWRDLIELAHTDKTEAFRRYAEHYLATDGQIYWSDRHQFSRYVAGYHQQVDQVLGHVGSEQLHEFHVPRRALVAFMRDAAALLRAHQADLIYGTIRLIEPDLDSFLPWARQDWACIVMNLHVAHTAAGQADSVAVSRALIDLAIGHGGSFYLTYHHHATPLQVLACYPEFPDFLRLKQQLDPAERWQSDWYRHYRDLAAWAGQVA